jgi:hypothetical protein
MVRTYIVRRVATVSSNSRHPASNEEGGANFSVFCSSILTAAGHATINLQQPPPRQQRCNNERVRQTTRRPHSDGTISSCSQFEGFEGQPRHHQRIWEAIHIHSYHHIIWAHTSIPVCSSLLFSCVCVCVWLCRSCLSRKVFNVDTKTNVRLSSQSLILLLLRAWG